MKKPRVAPGIAAVVVAALVAAAIAGLAVTQIWRRGQQPLTVQLQVAGGSMAPRIPGEHLAATCDDCGWHFRCGIEHPPQAQIAVCPNCGFQQQMSDRVHPATTLQVTAVEPGWAPARGDVVVFRHPQQQDLLVVKRIAALPGERVSFSQGDLLINGRVSAKTLPQLEAVAIPVHDDTFRPSAPRWQGGTAWQATAAGYQFQPEDAKSQEFAWLTYHHQRSYRSPQPRAPSAVTDAYGYNQGLSRTPRDVRDLLLNMQWRGEASFQIELLTAARPVALQRYGDNLEITYDGQIVKQAKLQTSANNGWQSLQLAICDDRVLYRSGETSGHVNLPPGTTATPTPLRIGARSGPLQIRNLTILRDVYYTMETRNSEQRTAGYYLLGDNAPVSTDSRHWPVRIQSDAIIGRIQRP